MEKWKEKSACHEKEKEVSGLFYGIRDAVRRWRQISKLQELLGRMTDEERKEFDVAIVQSDVEIYTDETGKPHVAPLDHWVVADEPPPKVTLNDGWVQRDFYAESIVSVKA